MRKMYGVFMSGGKEGNDWKYLVGVCPNREIAERLMRKSEKEDRPTISREEWSHMCSRFWEIEPVGTEEEIADIMHRQFPKYDREEIMKAYEYYDDEYRDCYVTEVDYYDE